MHRRRLIWNSIIAVAAAAVCSCGGVVRDPHALAWPQELPGGYRLDSASTEPPSKAPDDVKQLGVQRMHVAHYGGTGNLDITAYEMTASAGAFELLQNWRNTGGTMVMQEGNFFVVLRMEGASTQTLSPLSAAVQAWLLSRK